VKFLAVDFGERRIGLATSDASGTIATPRATIRRRSDAQAIEAIAAFVRDEEVDAVVGGLPCHADGQENEIAPRARSFFRKLQERLGLPFELLNEHLTTRAAGERYPRGVERDAAAAAVLLEDYLAVVRR
jgi:putative Holliday junction resolvase